MVEELKRQYDEQGYAIVRKAIDAGLAAETEEHVHWLIRKNPGVRPEAFFHNFLVNDPFMHRLVGDGRIVDILEPFLGPNIALYAPHYIAKPPGDGKPVLWHQDGVYWPLEPMEVMTVWLAGTASTRANGCMRVLPGTQNMRLLSRRAEMIDVDTEKYVLNSTIHPSLIDDSDVVDIELAAGDISLHNPRIIHGSEGNSSDSWRVGLTLRYIPTTTRVKADDWRNILVRGEPVDNGNLYADRPRYVPGEFMPFRGAEEWR